VVETGYRRGELQKLEWRDVHIDGDSPFFSIRRSTTKNHKAALCPMDAELADELRAVRPKDYDPKKRAFAGSIPRMPRFLQDLNEAGIKAIDGSGRRVDFHALRMTLSTDPSLLPTAAAIYGLPSLVKWTEPNTLHNTPSIDAEGLPVSPSVTSAANGESCGTLINTALGRDEAPVVAACHESQNGARYRVRTCDFLRVKQALYH
jgi:hypothetical protein